MKLPGFVLTLDAALALFNGNTTAADLLYAADHGHALVYIPATVLAEVRASAGAWAPILMFRGVHPLPLSEQVALALDDVAESLDDRHAAYEATLLGATVVTAGGQPWWGKGRPVLTI